MDYEQIDWIIQSRGFASEPAFTDVYVSVHDIPPEANAVGLYFPSSGTIVIPPDGYESVFIHELGHRYGHYHYDDLSEKFAESFRRRYQGGVSDTFYGDDVSYRNFCAQGPVYQIGSGTIPIVPFAILGAITGLLLIKRQHSYSRI
jgi:hypothetical protein